MAWKSSARAEFLVGDDRFYERMVPQADRIYDEHLKEIGHGKKV